MLLMHTERWSVDVCTNPNYNLIVSSKTSQAGVKPSPATVRELSEVHFTNYRQP